MSPRTTAEIPTSRYDRVAQRSADCVIAGYSTSFGWATRMLDEPVRTHVRSIYALVRIADETVDDPDPTFPVAERSRLLEDLAAEAARAVAGARSTNLVVQAYALTARRCGIGPELLDPFFASMRADLAVSRHDEASLAEYVHGSAEVVGLMCLRVFLGGDDAAFARLAPAASALGAAFQKVNFLRDLAEDHDELGRTYFPGLEIEEFGDAERDRLLDDIDTDLAHAATAIPHLPTSSRRAVTAAHGFYSALSRRLRATPAQQIRRTRVRVPDHEKAVIVARALLGARR
ncbi:MAG: phytoene/squalene synthase family protein [Brachybacterium sp.]|uniref:phytoene/squalene synthase family protein n=1 Tax=Brachybacterium sp. TaxID=1891286 RepID=UPI003F8F7AFB